MKTTRRNFLGGVAATTLPASAPAAEVPTTPSLNALLAVATPAERVRYHADALADAMAEMHHAQDGWRIQIDDEYRFALIAERTRVGSVRAIVDDGSPLLADDVTGTTAVADWEAGR